MNVVSIIILLVVIALFGGISYRLITRKKNRSCDGCGLYSVCKFKK